MKGFPLLPFCAIAIAATACASQVQSPNPVCIVGAGPGGLTIAHELEAKGISTVIFEKQTSVGGKCQEYYDGPDQSVYHPLGALLFTNQTYANTLPLIEAANSPLTPGISPANGWKYWLYGPGEEANNVTAQPQPNTAEAALIAAELVRYSVYWETKFAPNYTALRYTNGVPVEYTVPMGDWLASQGYLALPTIMEAGMVPYGYGDISQTPAIYMLQYFTPEVLEALAGIASMYIVDFHKVLVHYATSINGPIYLNATVTQIDRTGETPIVTYTNGTDGNVKTQNCTNVVLAFPPVLDTLKAVNLNLSPDELDVFSQVDITAYWSSAVETQTAYLNTYQQAPAEPLGAPVAFLRLFNESDVATVYSWGSIGSNLTLDMVTDLLVTTISEVQAGAGISSPNITGSNVKAIRGWEYFPHFNTSGLANGLYAKYNALQGQQSTYYSSALNGFETVEFAIRAGKDLVATFF